MARREEGAAAGEAAGTFAAEPARPAVDRRRTCSQPAGANLHRRHLSVVAVLCQSSVFFFSLSLPVLFFFFFFHCLCRCERNPEPTLLRHSAVVHGRLLRWIASTAVLLLGSIHLRMRSHGVALLGVAICHLRHARSGHAVPTSHAVAAHDTTTARRIASTGTIVRRLVYTDGAAVEPVDCAHTHENDS